MLSAFFDIRSDPKAAASAGVFGKKTPSTAAAAAKAATKQRARKTLQAPPAAAEPEGTEAATTHIHAGFVPLPPETNVPRPAEAEGQQAWQAYAESGAVKDDDVAEFKADWDEWDEMQEDGDASEPDFEPESLDPCIVSASPGIEDSLGSSVEDVPSFFLSRRRPSQGGTTAQGVPVYTGPQLCCEDEDFD